MEMYGEFVEILHHLLNVSAEFLRQVLDLVEHRLEAAKPCRVGRCSEDALEFAPDNRGLKLLRVCVSNTLENRRMKRLLAVFDKMEVTPVMDCPEIVLDDLWVIRSPIGSDHSSWFFLKDGSEKPANRLLGAVTDNGLSHRRTHQLVVDGEPIGAISVDCEILLIVGVDARIDGEIVLMTQRRFES